MRITFFMRFKNLTFLVKSCLLICTYGKFPSLAHLYSNTSFDGFIFPFISLSPIPLENLKDLIGITGAFKEETNL